MTQTSVLYCVNHPTVETTLRCNRCGNPICAKCAVRTPTGYRCPDCVRSQQKIFDTAVWYDYVLGFIVACLLSAAASFLITLIGSFGIFGWIILFFGAPTVGLVISEGIRLVIHHHRSRALFITILVALVLGALPVALVQLISFNLFGLIFQGIYLVLVVPTVYSRLSGIQLFR